MAVHDQRVNLIINQGRQLGRSLVLLAYYTTVFVAFMGRSLQWIAHAVEWTNVFGRYTLSAFDSVYRLVLWGKRKSIAGGARELCQKSELEPQ